MPYNKIKWIATAFLMTGGIFVVVPAAAVSWKTFAIFLIGHSMWAFAGVKMKDMPIVAINSFWICIDVVSIIMRIYV